MVFVDYFVHSFHAYGAPRTHQATNTVFWAVNVQRDVEQLRVP